MPEEERTEVIAPEETPAETETIEVNDKTEEVNEIPAETPVETKAAVEQEQQAEAVSQPEEKTETPASSDEVTESVKEEEEQKSESEKETEETETIRHRYADRLSKNYPDRKFETDDDYDKAMDEWVEGLENYRERGIKANQNLISVFQGEPQFGDLLRDMVKGATFAEAFPRHYSIEDFKPVEGDPDQEKWTKNANVREENIKKIQQRQEEYNNNVELSRKEIETFSQENKIDDDVMGKFLSKFDAMLADVSKGKINKELLLIMKKGLDYDKDIEKAKTQGEVVGKNKNIVAQKEADKPKGDGLPKVGGSSELPKNRPVPNYMDGLIERTEKRKVL